MSRIKREQSGRRLVAWIDAVGGYLLCLADQVSLGQASPRRAADIPIQADLSRRHAVICRDGESYVLTPIHTVRVDGVKLTGPMVVRDQALLQLGDSVQLAISPSACTQCNGHADPGVAPPDRTGRRCDRADGG